MRELFARRPDLDAVIDLTNTKRYYDPGDMRRAAPRPEEFEHFKILTKGHEVPNRDVVRRWESMKNAVILDVNKTAITFQFQVPGSCGYSIGQEER